MNYKSLKDVNELLGMLARTTTRPGDLISVLRNIALTAQVFFAADSCVIFAINTITGEFIPSLTIAGDTLRGESYYKEPSSQGLAKQVLRQGIFLVEDLEATPEYQSTITHSENIRAFAALALHVRNQQKSLGILYLNFRHAQQFAPEDHELLQIFRDQASLILQETWLLQRYQEVERIGQEINQDLDTADVLFQKLQQYVSSILDASYTLLLAIHQKQTNTLDLYIEEKGRFIVKNDVSMFGACQYIIDTQKTIFVQQSSEEATNLPFKLDSIEGIGPKESFIFVPLTLRDVTLGVLSIQHPNPHAYNEEDLFILHLLANHTALAVHNIHLYGSLKQLNETGQILTRELEAEQTLQLTAEKIREASRADVVVLYSYDNKLGNFILPPCIAGDVLASTFESMSPKRPDDIAALMLHRNKPIFAKESPKLYRDLLNDATGLGSFVQREKISSTAAMPLRVGNESVGVLFANFRQPQRFDATQKLFIEGLAHFAAIAIKNAQIFGTLSTRRRREMNIVQNIDRELSRNSDLKATLDTVLILANESVPAEVAAILLYNPQTEILETVSAIGSHAEASRKLIIPIKETNAIIRWVLQNKKPALVHNVHLDPWRETYTSTAEETLSELDVPLLDGEEVVGVLNFESRKEGAFSQEDQSFLNILAGLIVVAIKKAQAYSRETRLTEEGQALSKISKEIISQLDWDSVFDLIMEKALELTHSTLGALLRYDPKRNDLQIVAERGVVEGKKHSRISMNHGVAGYVARYKTLVNIPDLSQQPWNEIFLDYIPGTRSELAVPMLAEDNILGVLNVESHIPNHFNKNDEQLLQGLADLAVIAQQNAERYGQAKRATQRFALLYKAGQELGELTEYTQIDQAHDIILRIAHEYSPNQITIRRYDDGTHELELIRSSIHQQSSLFSRTSVDEGINGQVAREKRTILISNISNPPADVVPAVLADPSTGSLLIIPIIFKDRYYGNLGLGHEEEGYFQDTDQKFFEGLALQLAITIYRLETTEERQEFQKRALSAEEMSSIGQFAYELTHRLGNDLGLIDYYLDCIRSELEELQATDEQILEKLGKIARAARRVLDFSGELKQKLKQPEEARAETPILIHPRKLLEKALDYFQDTLALKPTIQVQLDTHSDVGTVQIILTLIVDALINLIANAIDAMPEGGSLLLLAHNIDRSVALEITDTGVGIPSEIHTKIFELSFSTKGSSGFGLWSARSNILKNRGDLKVKSQIGQGTTFTILLPKY